MDGIIILAVVLCVIAAGMGAWYVAVKIYELDHMPTRREVERDYYEADWNRIMAMTQLDKPEEK